MRKFLLNIIWLVILVSCSTDSNRIEYLNYRIDSLSSNLNSVQNAYRSSYFLKIDTINPLLLAVDDNFDTCNLGDVIQNTNRLFFHYTDNHCSSCLNKQFEKIQQFQRELGSEKLCIIGSLQSYRSVVGLVNNYGIECNIYIVPYNLSIFKHNPFFSEPFYFTLQDGGSIDMFHFPSENNTISTNLFLNICKEKITS